MLTEGEIRYTPPFGTEELTVRRDEDYDELSNKIFKFGDKTIVLYFRDHLKLTPTDFLHWASKYDHHTGTYIYGYRYGVIIDNLKMWLHKEVTPKDIEHAYISAQPHNENMSALIRHIRDDLKRTPQTMTLVTPEEFKKSGEEDIAQFPRLYVERRFDDKPPYKEFRCYKLDDPYAYTYQYLESQIFGWIITRIIEREKLRNPQMLEAKLAQDFHNFWCGHPQIAENIQLNEAKKSMKVLEIKETKSNNENFLDTYRTKTGKLLSDADKELMKDVMERARMYEID